MQHTDGFRICYMSEAFDILSNISNKKQADLSKARLLSTQHFTSCDQWTLWLLLPKPDMEIFEPVTSVSLPQ